MLALPAPGWLRLSRLLAEVTQPCWPGKRDGHFSDRAFEEDTDSVEAEAEAAGFYVVGCGNFTAVFAHEDAPDVVFKLNAGTRDKMEDYHRWLMTQDHPNLPRVYHVEHYMGGCVAVSEVLDEDGDFDDLPLGELIALLGDAGFDVDDACHGNIMLRGDVPVLNDPSSNRADSFGYNPEYS